MQIDDDQMALTTSLGTGGTIINGSRGNTNSLMVDGGFNLDSGSNASQINNVGLDFIDQVSDPDVELLGRVRAQFRRGHQRRDQERHQQVTAAACST